MKVSLINPSPHDSLYELSGRKNFISASWPPLGLLYLATVLEALGVEVSILDQPAKGFTLEETVKWVENEDPTVLGFTTLSTSGITAARISNEVKRRDPDVSIVFGGPYSTFNSARVLDKYPSVDIIVRGEGERTLVELVRHLEEGRSSGLTNVLGISFREGDDVIQTPDRPLIQNVDALPFPNRGLLDVEYHSMIVGARLASRRFTSLISSRGCVYRCRFCTCPQSSCNIWRPRSVENVVEELSYLVGEGFEQFVFVDDSFTLNPKRTMELCRTIRQEHLDIEWFCEGRVDQCSGALMKELARAGCKVLFLGIESANQRILDYYNKGITPAQSKKAVETARKAGIDLIIGSFVLGAPDETREEIQNTIEFAKSLPIDFPQINVLSASPGSDIWNELATKGILNEEEYWETSVLVPKIDPRAVP
jgi:radical SAM superfamily enzyme YgiQ (UPF0313 family)